MTSIGTVPSEPKLTLPGIAASRRQRRKPVVSAVRAINEAAAKAKDAGLNFDEFIGAAVWAGWLNKLDIPAQSYTDALVDHLLVLNEWEAVEEKMEAEKSP